MNQTPSTIERRLGRDNALRLIQIVGGTRLRVPGDPRNGGRLERTLGHDLAVLVILHFGDQLLSVPLSLDGLGAQGKPVDRRKVKRLTAKGWSAARIARHLGCSERTIYAKRAQLRSSTSTTGRNNDSE